MSRQQSLEQQRAAQAWDCVRGVKEQAYARDYGSLARNAPADVQANGLGQMLAFWRAKGCQNGRPAHGGDNAHYQLLEHVSGRVRSELRLVEAVDVLVWIMNEATTEHYRRATAEAIAFLVWVKRFAEAELPTETAEGKER
ncbi:MAG: type III-B CRISPR module-associated protein Cmr5 [Chloroflexi bacterium]|nr:type III-B CRISPR module-associated protein Cmr5 [Chloroflexota bacterium]